MKMKGKIINWNAAKAFGFIEPVGCKDQVFIHISAFNNKKRTPKTDDMVTFTLSKDDQGRYCAAGAIYSGEKAQTKHTNNRDKLGKFSIYLAVLFLSIITIFYLQKDIPQTLLIAYAGLSVLTFVTYWLDKKKAQRDAWRIQESTLHLLALLGGWPGAAIAQQVFRHKTQKRSFKISFWVTVVTNCCALAWLMSANGQSLMELFS